MIWISSSGERSLKLASVSRIVPGQRTVRYSILLWYMYFWVDITVRLKSCSCTYSNFIWYQYLLQAVFQRYLRPEKDYLSFSLIYNNGKRSLDLVSGGSLNSICNYIVSNSYFYNNIINDNLLLLPSRFARTKLRQKCGLQASKH